MPLYKKRPFCLIEPPQDLDPHDLVFQVRFTKEIFRDFQEYLNRLNLYRQRVWTCKVTGKTNLTYEEALVSERRATEKVQQFPKELIAPVLQMIQFSTLSLIDLVNEIRTKLQETKLQEKLFEGLELLGRRGGSFCACKILKIVEDGNEVQYEVGWIDGNKKVTDTSIVKAEDLIRKKPLLGRNVLKAFVRESTSQRDPWMVHDKLAKKHGIRTEPPEDLRDKLTFQNGYRVIKESKKLGKNNIVDVQNLKASKKRKEADDENLAGSEVIKKKRKKEEEKPKEEPIKYPIDDLLVQPAADDPVFMDRPSLSTDFRVPMECVGDLLMVWDFCSSFSRFLLLYPFSLEDFENAICHKDSNLILIVELHSSILHLLIKDEGNYFMAIRKRRRKSKITLVNWSEYLCDFLELEDRADFSTHVKTIRRGHYGLLDTRVKLSILKELIMEVLDTDAMRDKLSDCIEQREALAGAKREEVRKKKDEKHLKKEESNDKSLNQGHTLENGRVKPHNCDGMSEHHEDMLGERNHISENGERKLGVFNSKGVAKKLRMGDGGHAGKAKHLFGIRENMKVKRRGKYKDKENQEKKPEEDREQQLEREMEKLSIRTSPLGKDRNYNRYWFFRREGRIFVESSDSKKWGYYTTKEELDALIGSLNPKGERERALQKQLVKCYPKISTALHKRSKDIAQRILLEEAVVRRSTRVRAQPRDSPAMAFLRYVNKWKEN